MPGHVGVADAVHRHVIGAVRLRPSQQRGVEQRRTGRIQFRDEGVGHAVRGSVERVCRGRVIRRRGDARDPRVPRRVEGNAVGALAGRAAEDRGVHERRTGGVDLRHEVVAAVRRGVQRTGCRRVVERTGSACHVRLAGIVDGEPAASVRALSAKIGGVDQRRA